MTPNGDRIRNSVVPDGSETFLSYDDGVTQMTDYLMPMGDPLDRLRIPAGFQIHRKEPPTNDFEGFVGLAYIDNGRDCEISVARLVEPSAYSRRELPTEVSKREKQIVRIGTSCDDVPDR